MKKTGVFLAEGFEEIEGLTVVDILRRAGIDVVTISVMGQKEVCGSHKITVLADALFEEVNFEEYEGIVLPGGMPGTTNLGGHSGVNQIIKSFAEQGNWWRLSARRPVFWDRPEYWRERKLPAIRDLKISSPERK